MSVGIRQISNTHVADLVGDIERQGFAIIPDFIGAKDLVRMQRFVAEAVQNAGGEYAGFTGPSAVTGSGLDELAGSQVFRELIQRIYECGTGQKAPQQEFYQVLRCLSGQNARKHSYIYHYDSYIVTALIPIEIPAVGPSGDFLMLPNTRRVRKFYLTNVIDKLLLDNTLTQWALRKLAGLGLIRLTRVKLIPGNAYLFWGYRSIHTNEPCDPNHIRGTALFHYINPHATTRPFAKLRAWLPSGAEITRPGTYPASISGTPAGLGSGSPAAGAARCFN
jgi:hypothetical protein